MAKEVRRTEFDAGSGSGCEDERVLEWELGLPSSEDLTPLSQRLIPPELASAFNILPEPCRSIMDVNRASQNTISSIRGNSLLFPSSNSFKFESFNEDGGRNGLVVEGEEADLTRDGSDSRKIRRVDNEATEEVDSALQSENDDGSKTLKRPRLVWTPQLHKRFVDVVRHLGLKNAVPKTIMQLMNVEGLTRENVASHLQKYRLYMKRMQGPSNEQLSPSDHLFTSTPVAQSLNEFGGNTPGHGNGHLTMPMPIPMTYPAQLMHMPVMGMSHGHGHMGMPGPSPYHHGFESHPWMQARDSSGNKLGSNGSYLHTGSNDK